MSIRLLLCIFSIYYTTQYKENTFRKSEIPPSIYLFLFIMVDYFFPGVTVKLAKLAKHGDALSQHLFAEAGSTLAAHIAALAHKSTAARLRVVCVGSVWNSWDALKPGVLSELHSRRVGQ